VPQNVSSTNFLLRSAADTPYHAGTLKSGLIRLKTALLAVEVPRDNKSEPALLALEAGCVLRLDEKPRGWTDLVDVQVEDKLYMVFFSDVQKCGEQLPVARASGNLHD
jgi:hypothetical protein